MLLLAVGLTPAAPSGKPRGTLTENRIIESEILGYRLQYRVYLPPGAIQHDDLPVLYVADGQWYIEGGDLPRLLDRMISRGEIRPVAAVFVDNRNPDDLAENRRNRQFFCNEKYSAFYQQELIPTIDETFATSAERTGRVILGMSFGGLNAACFGLQAHDSFGGIAMQSPAVHPVPELHDAWAGTERLPLRIFLSSGTVNDNEGSTRRLHKILDDKGYDLHYVEVDQGHDWRNWKPLLDDMLRFFFSAS